MNPVFSIEYIHPATSSSIFVQYLIEYIHLKDSSIEMS